MVIQRYQQIATTPEIKFSGVISYDFANLFILSM